MNIVVFNGPANSGKDAAGRAINSTHVLFKFAQPIDDAIIAFMGEDTEMGRLYQAVVQDPKRKEERLFNGHSSRKLKIGFSEKWVKQYLGKRIFGEICAERILKFSETFTFSNFVITDCGFQMEFDAFCEVIHGRNPASKITLVRILRTGRTFVGDSRWYVEPNIYTNQYFEHHNDDSLENHEQRIRELIYEERTGT